MQKPELRCLGVGDGWPSARNHSAFLFRFRESSLLIDCGEPVSRLLLQAGVGYDEIDSIILSHLHFDHIGGFFMLMQSMWLKRREKQLVVHLPPDGIAPIEQLLRASCIYDELLAFRLRFEPLLARQPLSIGQTRVTPFPTSHLATFRELFSSKYPQDFAAFCFLIEADGLRIGHSADIGAPDDLDPLLSRPLDMLVCELAHIEVEQLFEHLSSRQIRRIVFVHLSQKQLDRLDHIKSLAEKHLPQVQISFATDGQGFPL